MEKGPRGQPSKWGPLLRAELRAAIDDMIRDHPTPALTPTSAAAILAKRERWKSLLGNSKRPADALRKQYEEADPRWVMVWRKTQALEFYQADPNKDLEAAERRAGVEPSGTK